ncbi:MAG: VOC family protein [Acidobacteria bacterium]|nr:VOC family protein [Acidobacteriota bacterium]
MIRLQRLDHVGLYVRDLERAKEFYCGVLGLKLVARFGDLMLLNLADVNVALFHNPVIAPADPDILQSPLGKAHHAFLVSSDDLRSAQRSLEKAGVPTHGPVDWGDHDGLYFLDPDGNLLELVTPRRGKS